MINKFIKDVLKDAFKEFFSPLVTLWEKLKHER